jgi:hypothetical protein
MFMREAAFVVSIRHPAVCPLFWKSPLTEGHLRKFVLRCRPYIDAFLRVVWVCRVSVVGVVGPALVLYYAPQARDLFSYFHDQMVSGQVKPDVFQVRF